MKTYVEEKEMIVEIATTLDMEPDILALASYLARRREISLGEFLERLITNHQIGGKEDESTSNQRDGAS